MKQANGYGSVYKLSGNRRRPYTARITVGWDEKKHPKYQYIGYYATEKEALKALADFNESPYADQVKHKTFAEVFQEWKVLKFSTISKSTIIAYNSAFNISAPLHDEAFVKLRTVHLQDMLDNSGKNYPMRQKTINMIRQLYKHAIENDLVDKNYGKYLTPGKKEKTDKKIPFSAKEMQLLHDHVESMTLIDSIIVMIYTGFRVGELLDIENANVDLENWTIIGGSKTEAGMNRIVPISKHIRPLIEKRYDSSNKYLFTRKNGKPYTYSNYLRENWNRIMESLGMDHRPHECRHTFITMMNKAGADKLALQKIVGHVNFDTTIGYTHIDIQELRDTIDLL